MAGLKVVSIKSLADGSLDLSDLRTKAEKHRDNLAAFMVSFVSATNVDGTY
jgi:glycine dehydrogenase